MNDLQGKERSKYLLGMLKSMREHFEDPDEFKEGSCHILAFELCNAMPELKPVVMTLEDEAGYFYTHTIIQDPLSQETYDIDGNDAKDRWEMMAFCGELGGRNPSWEPCRDSQDMADLINDMDSDLYWGDATHKEVRTCIEKWNAKCVALASTIQENYPQLLKQYKNLAEQGQEKSLLNPLGMAEKAQQFGLGKHQYKALANALVFEGILHVSLPSENIKTLNSPKRPEELSR